MSQGLKILKLGLLSVQCNDIAACVGSCLIAKSQSTYNSKSGKGAIFFGKGQDVAP